MRIFWTEDGERLQLAARERQVLRLIALGAAKKTIAHQLGITEGTVKVYTCRLFLLLGLSSRVEVALWCVCHPEALNGVPVAREPRIPACLLPAA
jgi:DNA-binding NarL/FixJ family response regulator